MESGGNKKESLVVQKRRAAFQEVSQEMTERLSSDVGASFEAHGREYEVTSAEDCMLAYAQNLRSELAVLHDEVVARDNYYEEKATAKLLELFTLYERLMALYAELRTEYPSASATVETHLPLLEAAYAHGATLFDQHNQSKQS